MLETPSEAVVDTDNFPLPNELILNVALFLNDKDRRAFAAVAKRLREALQTQVSFYVDTLVAKGILPPVTDEYQPRCFPGIENYYPKGIRFWRRVYDAAYTVNLTNPMGLHPFTIRLLGDENPGVLVQHFFEDSIESGEIYSVGFMVFNESEHSLLLEAVRCGLLPVVKAFFAVLQSAFFWEDFIEKHGAALIRALMEAGDPDLADLVISWFLDRTTIGEWVRCY